MEFEDLSRAAVITPEAGYKFAGLRKRIKLNLLLIRCEPTAGKFKPQSKFYLLAGSINKKYGC